MWYNQHSTSSRPTWSGWWCADLQRIRTAGDDGERWHRSSEAKKTSWWLYRSTVLHRWWRCLRHQDLADETLLAAAADKRDADLQLPTQQGTKNSGECLWYLGQQMAGSAEEDLAGAWYSHSCRHILHLPPQPHEDEIPHPAATDGRPWRQVPQHPWGRMETGSRPARSRHRHQRQPRLKGSQTTERLPEGILQLCRRSRPMAEQNGRLNLQHKSRSF